jgi:TctA family transporter
VFFTRPISGTIMVIALLTIVYPVFRQLRKRRQTPFSEPT